MRVGRNPRTISSACPRTRFRRFHTPGGDEWFCLSSLQADSDRRRSGDRAGPDGSTALQSAPRFLIRKSAAAFALASKIGTTKAEQARADRLNGNIETSVGRKADKHCTNLAGFAGYFLARRMQAQGCPGFSSWAGPAQQIGVVAGPLKLAARDPRGQRLLARDIGRCPRHVAANFFRSSIALKAAALTCG
ncbi:hypothetical protein J2R76_003542 [Bradyrhizobium sp. USDA 4532]|nr:hypothetical protein [Bradyrhizobium sp. USDA 4545]MCP1919951.1 hypothetical protein [Bradyrhizobium sp. USDA 4532]